MFPVNRWILASRPRTLPAALVPVLIGTALAFRAGQWNAVPAFLCAAFAVLIQIGTNFANDYYDYLKGADGETRVGPQRAVASGWISPGTMRVATGGVLLLAFTLGLGLIPYGGWWLLAIGVSSVILALAYTAGPYPLAYVGLGDFFVVLYFGLIAVSVTERVQTGTFSTAGLALGLAAGLLANNLLVVNNHRDAPEDAKVGKRTLTVRFGRGFSEVQMGLSLGIAALIPVWIGWINGWWGLALAAVVALCGWKDVSGLRRAVTAPEYGAVLAATARRLVYFGGATSLGIVLPFPFA